MARVGEAAASGAEALFFEGVCDFFNEVCLRHRAGRVVLRIHVRAMRIRWRSEEAGKGACGRRKKFASVSLEVGVCREQYEGLSTAGADGSKVAEIDGQDAPCLVTLSGSDH